MARKKTAHFNRKARRDVPRDAINDDMPLPASRDDDEGRLTPRHPGFVREADRIVDESTGRTVLMQAVIKGDLALASRIVRSGADVNRADRQGRTALHHAATQGNAAIASLLLAQGADPNIVNAQGDTPLLAALEKDAGIGVADALVAAAANVNLVGKSGLLPLHLAVQRAAAPGALALVENILAATDNPDQPDGKGQTALHFAARTGHREVMDLLLFQRLDCFLATHDATTCLHDAAAAPQTGAAEALLESRAAELLNAVNHAGRTPLHAAVEAKHESLVRLMLQKGALTGFYDDKGLAPLHLAVKAGELALVFLLLDNGADINAGDGKTGVTPLLAAIRAGKADTVRQLLAQGADPNRADALGITPLMAACATGDDALVATQSHDSEDLY